MNHASKVDSATISATRAFIERIETRYPFAGAILFGSRARKTHESDSDADVAVLLRGHRNKFMATKLEMADVAFDVLLETGVLVSPLPIWLDEWEHPEAYANPALLANIRREGVRL